VGLWPKARVGEEKLDAKINDKNARMTKPAKRCNKGCPASLDKF
jgi:hypothetical protein